MPRYRIFHLKERRTEAYRETPPKPKPYRLKSQDYEEAGSIEAPSPYAAWKQLREAAEQKEGLRELAVGDVLEDGASLYLMNFWGFDEAEWEPAAASRPAEHLAGLSGSGAGAGKPPWGRSGAAGAE